MALMKRHITIARTAFTFTFIVILCLFSFYLLGGSFHSDKKLLSDIRNVEKELSHDYPHLSHFKYHFQDIHESRDRYYKIDTSTQPLYQVFGYVILNSLLYSWNTLSHFTSAPLAYMMLELLNAKNLILEKVSIYRYGQAPKQLRHKMNLYLASQVELFDNASQAASVANTKKQPIIVDKIYLVHYVEKKASSIDQKRSPNKNLETPSVSDRKSPIEHVRRIISKRNYPSLGRHLYLTNGGDVYNLCQHSQLECRFMEWSEREKLDMYAPTLNHLGSDLVFSFTTMSNDLQDLINTHKLDVHGNNIILASQDEELKKSIFKELLSHDSVYHVNVSLRRLNQLNNYSGNKIIQGRMYKKFARATSEDSMDMALNHTFIWNHGVRGKNQIVGIGDTGIDFDNCYFIDKVNEVNVVPNTPLPNHRKIVYYKKMKVVENGITYEADGQDLSAGHGSHTAGSIVGSIHPNHTNFDELSKYNGVAPDAKLFMQDINSPSVPFLIIPSDLISYFKEPYDYGARIHSNSWGCDFSSQFTCSMDCVCKWSVTNSFGQQPFTIVKDSFCQSKFGTRCCEYCSIYDKQAEEVDTFLDTHDEMTILFASGNNGDASYKSNLGTPSVSKNAIAVGASMTLNEGFIDSVSKTDFSAIMNELKRITGGILSFKDTDACCNYSGQEADLIHLYCCPRDIVNMYIQRKDVYSEINLAPFSSKGPIPADNRYGIDVVAPGMVVASAFSDGKIDSMNCGSIPPSKSNDAALIKKEGTSMSCPLVAGSAALVRDYYESGYYPTGIKNPDNSIKNLSGMLVKATILHSGQPLTGHIPLGQFTTRIPNVYPNSDVGYGLVTLESVLKFNESIFDLFVINRKEIDEGDRHPVCFKVKDGSSNPTHIEFRATLVWYDEKGSHNMDSVINDLELNAWTQKGEQYTYYPGNNNPEHDIVNTAEQIRIPIKGNENGIVISVEGISQNRKQNYALVVTYSKHFEIVDSCHVPDRPSAPYSLSSILFLTFIIGGSVLVTCTTLLVVFGTIIALVSISLGKTDDRNHSNVDEELESEGDIVNDDDDIVNDEDLVMG